MTRFLIPSILAYSVLARAEDVLWAGGFPHLDYQAIRESDMPQPRVATASPATTVEVDVSRARGPWKMERTFQEEDCLKNAIKMQAVLQPVRFG